MKHSLFPHSFGFHCSDPPLTQMFAGNSDYLATNRAIFQGQSIFLNNVRTFNYKVVIILLT